MQKDVIKNIDIKQLKIKTHFFERKNGTFQLLSVEYIILNDQFTSCDATCFDDLSQHQPVSRSE
jgi:hypothetical protein